MNRSDAERQTAAVEDALRSMPLRPVPATLRIRIMRQVRSSPRAPGFVLPWLEGALSLLLSMMAASMVYAMMTLQPVFRIRLEQSIRLFLQFPANRAFLAAAVPALGLMAVCLLTTALLFRPRRRSARVVPTR
jgi:hypothetical protein